MGEGGTGGSFPLTSYLKGERKERLRERWRERGGGEGKEPKREVIS